MNPTEKSKAYLPAAVFISVSGAWFLILMHLPLYNLGGSGFILPQNILTWVIVAVLCGIIISMNTRRSIIFTPFLALLIFASVLMTIPLLWSADPVTESSSIARFIGLWAGVFFYFCLLQLRFTEKMLQTCLWFIALSAMVEGGIVLQTLFLPGTLSETGLQFYINNGLSAAGTFQQVNVTASWLATGLVAQLVLILRDRSDVGKTCRYNGLRYVRPALSAIITTMLSACIVLTRSRVGWLGGSLCYLIISLCLLSSKKKHSPHAGKTLVLVFAPLVGTALGLMLLDGTPAQAISHDASNYQRLLTLKETWQMIMLLPFKGWGGGTYQEAFQRYMASHFVNNPSHELMEHPHNELLYVWFEGGVIALLGYLFIMLGICRLCLRGLSMQRCTLGTTLIPIFLHTGTEFPLYYSAAHFVVLLILLVLLDQPGGTRQAAFTLPDKMRSVSILIRITAVLVSICIILWLIKAFYMAHLLSHFEDGTLDKPDKIVQMTPPSLTRERYLHDLNLLNLVHYYGSGNQKFLNNYVLTNTEWLKHHPEPDDYDNQIRVLRVVGQPERAEIYRQAAKQLFPWDQRF
ncbi:hypothetical protein ERD95_15005 [Enterobacteriaceae bacterium ML5]|nr:hypothetical protein ERD95_15005 [Enterobacteriaceae bacterium ML5]